MSMMETCVVGDAWRGDCRGSTIVGGLMEQIGLPVPVGTDPLVLARAILLVGESLQKPVLVHWHTECILAVASCSCQARAIIKVSAPPIHDGESPKVNVQNSRLNPAICMPPHILASLQVCSFGCISWFWRLSWFSMAENFDISRDVSGERCGWHGNHLMEMFCRKPLNFVRLWRNQIFVSFF